MSGTILAAGEKESSSAIGISADCSGSPSLIMVYQDPSNGSSVKVEISKNGLIRLSMPWGQTDERSRLLLVQLQRALIELLLRQDGDVTYFNNLADLTRTGYLTGSGSTGSSLLRTQRASWGGKEKSSSAA